MKTQRLFRLFSIAVLVVAFLGVHTTSVSASVTFVVTQVNEGDDANPGDGICATAGGPCTLRAAIQEANANLGADTIQFNLPGGGVHVISITSGPLPVITEQLTLDGTSQPNCTVPCIVLSGAALAGANTGLEITASDNIVKGFIITSWDVGILILNLSNNNQIQSNDIGFWPGNPASLPNDTGIWIYGANNLVGGTLASQRNVISGNLYAGINVGNGGFATSDNIIRGNYIGTNETGSAALANGQAGIYIQGSVNTVIGGATASARNVISGNGTGIFVDGGIGTLIQGNFIGTNAAGSGALGNGAAGGIWIGGIWIENGATRTQVGGTTASMGNRIAFNTGAGITVADSITIRNTIRRNSIYKNSQLGIDLGNNGVTPNDTRDPDLGPNRLQNYPVLTSAKSATRVIAGRLNSKPNQTFVLEFFSTPANMGCDPSHYGEGRTFLGLASVITNATGVASFSRAMTFAFPVGSIITATATDSLGNTSEFSACRTAN
jgi:CSLREA domain-containing protein